VPGDDADDDRSLRPRRLQDFVGQEGIREQLAVSIEAATARVAAKEPRDIVTGISWGSR